MVLMGGRGGRGVVRRLGRVCVLGGGGGVRAWREDWEESRIGRTKSELD